MAERKSGPVKPPVIDLKARESGATGAARGAPHPQTDAASERGASPHPPASPVPPPHEGEGVRTDSPATGAESTTTEGAARAPSPSWGGGTARSAVCGEPHAPNEEGKPQDSERGASPHPPASPVPPPQDSSRSVPSPRSGSGPTAEGEG